MKALEKFIELHTNAIGFYESYYRPHEVDVSEINLDLQTIPGYPWGLLSYAEYQESWMLEVEENTTHPIIAIQMAVQELWNVLISLHDIQTEIILQAGYLNLVRDKE